MGEGLLEEVARLRHLATEVVTRRIASMYWIMEDAGIADSASGEVKELDD